VLYATGKPNRAVVRDTLSRSAAREAGVEPGDVVWRYDGNLVLHPRDLQRATASGVEGELVPVDVIRGGERVRLYVRRGPLGALLERKKVSPDA
jgi:S1-C subfamily serine protease